MTAKFPKTRTGFTTYAAILPDGTVLYRQTKRTYTHAVIVDGASDLKGGADNPNYRPGWGEWGMASRYDLAVKTAATAGKCYADVRIVEVLPVTEPVDPCYLGGNVEAEVDPADELAEELGGIDPVTGKIDGTMTMTVDSAALAGFYRQAENSIIAERVGRMAEHWGEAAIEVVGGSVTYKTRLAGNDRRVRITVEVLDD